MSVEKYLTETLLRVGIIRPKGLQPLWDAIEQGDLNAMARAMPSGKHLVGSDLEQTLYIALEQRLSTQGFALLMDRVPRQALATLAATKASAAPAYAVERDRADVLTLFAQRGVELMWTGDFSLLDLAVKTGALECVKWLMSTPARVQARQMLRQRMMTKLMPFTRWNKQVTLTPLDLAALFDVEGPAEEYGVVEDGISMVLVEMPELLEEEETRQCLVVRALTSTEEVAGKLAPWLGLLQEQTVRLPDIPGGLGCIGIQNLLGLWRQRLPQGPIPCLDREMELGVTEASHRLTRPVEELLEELFALCPAISEEISTRRISPLAAEVARYGSPRLIARQFMPGGLFATEDPEALARFCRTQRDIPEGNRAAILANLEQEDRPFTL